MLYSNLDKAQPPLERQVRRSGMCAETLRRAADHDADSVSRPSAKDGVARALGDGADALREDEVAIDREVEVGGEG